MNYKEIQDKHSKELNDFKGIFFAFNKKQLREGMEKVGVTSENEIKSCGAGLFLRNDRFEAFKGMLKRHKQEREEWWKNPENLLHALIYELRNHEYCLTGDPTDALNALDLEEEDIPEEIFQRAIETAADDY